MPQLAETSVNFLIIADSNGGMKVVVDGATKKQPARDLDEMSLRSIQTVSTNTVKVGNRRRLPSNSSVSVSSFATGNTFALLDEAWNSELRNAPLTVTESTTSLDKITNEHFEEIHEEDRYLTSTPLPTENFSDCSFSSCVSRLSLDTASSQETIINEKPIEKVVQKAVAPKSYERVNQERFGYSSVDAENWRLVGPKKKSQQTPPTNQRASNIPRFSSLSDSQKNRSTMRSPVSPTTTIPTSAPAPIKLNLQMKLRTGSDGKIRLQFINSKNSESFCVDGIFQNFDDIEVQRISDANNN